MNVNGKEILYAFIRQLERVDDLRERMIEARSGATRTTRQIDGLMVDHSKGIDRRAENLIILSERYDMELARLFSIESDLLCVIGRIGNNIHATFLIRKYILLQSYDDIATTLDYSTQQLRRINVKCLDVLSEIVL